MKKEDFELLYNTHSLYDLCRILDCSAPTIYKRLDEYGIRKKGQGKGARRKKKLIIEE